MSRIALAALALIAAAPAMAAPEFVRLGRIHGALTRPDTGPPPHVAILYENGDGTGQLMCTELAKRGFVTLCLAEGPHPQGWEPVALEVKAGMDFLRALPGITKVVLYGHSGGGAIASFYQAVAEKGVAFCQDPQKLSRCPDSLANLPRADAVVFADAHPGLGVMDLREINPSLRVTGERITIDPALDPYNPANGFNPAGASRYPPAFRERYARAQAAEMTRLIGEAQRLRAGLAAGTVTDPAADAVVTRGGRTAHIDQLDPSIPDTMATALPRRLLRDDGTIVTQIVRSSLASNFALVPKGLPAALRRHDTNLFLSRGSVGARDSWSDIDWCSSNSVTMCNVTAITVPTLVIPSGADNFIGDGERMFERSAARDKEFIVVEGASHGGAPCVPCEPSPGAYANAQKNLFDHIAAWINARF